MKAKKSILSFLVAILVFSGPTHAYLDPGSGSLMLQLLLGGVAGLVVAGKLLWTRILDFLGLAKHDPASADNNDED